MQTYVHLINWTEQGVKSVKDTVSRSEKASQFASELGGRILGFYWTQGRYDLVVISEWPDETSATAFILAQAGAGNIRSETLRSFSAEDMTRILDKMR